MEIGAVTAVTRKGDEALSDVTKKGVNFNGGRGWTSQVGGDSDESASCEVDFTALVT